MFWWCVVRFCPAVAVVFCWWWLVCVSSSVCMFLFFFLRFRRPPRSTLDRSSAASDGYKSQMVADAPSLYSLRARLKSKLADHVIVGHNVEFDPVSYTHLRAPETVLDIVCRLLLEKQTTTTRYNPSTCDQAKNHKNTSHSSHSVRVTHSIRFLHV
mgnify:CR=1 FL=1